jgi:hypothetical protein
MSRALPPVFLVPKSCMPAARAGKLAAFVLLRTHREVGVAERRQDTESMGIRDPTIERARQRRILIFLPRPATGDPS